MLSFVLSRRDFKENDQMITVFTAEKGKIEVLAKGVKKVTAKNSAFLEPFFLIEAEIVEGKEFFRLTTATPVESFKEIRVDWQKSLMSGYATEVLARLLPNNQPENKIFKLFFSFLKFLTQTKEVNRIFSIAFVWKVFAMQGYLPNLDTCVVCKQENNLNFFSSLNGGLLCDNCRDKNLYLQKAILLQEKDKENLKTLIRNDWPEIKMNKEEVIKQEQILGDFCAYHSEKKIPPLSPLLD